MKTLLLHNPTAGTEDHDRLDLLARLEDAGFEPDYCSTKSDRFPAVLSEDHDLVVVAGGDGTVRKVATQFERRDVPMLIVPMGTANNIARSLQIPLGHFELPSPHRIADHLVDLDIAIGTFGDVEKLLAEGVGMGALAATMDDKVGKGEKGEAKILAAREVVAKVIRKAAPFKATLLVDGRPIEGEFLIVEALLHAFCGPALPLCPIADSGDGLIDVVLVEEAMREAMAAWVMSPKNSDPPVRIERGKKITLEWSRKPALRSDDKRLDLRGSVKSIGMRMLKEPLKVVLPKAEPDAAMTDREGEVA